MQIDFHRQWIMYGSAGVPAFLEPTAWTPAQLFFRDSGISNETLVLWRGDVLDWLFDGQQLDAYAEYFLPRLLHDKWKVFDQWQVKIPEFEAVQKHIMQADLHQLSEADVLSLARKLFSTFTEQYALNNWIEPVSFYFQHHLASLLEPHGLTADQAHAAIQEFGSPVKPSYVKQCLEAYSQAKTSEEVQTVLDEFYYIKNDYTGVKVLTEEGIKEMMGGQASEDRSAFAVLLSPQAKALLEALQLTATVQDVRKEYILKWVSAAARIIQDLAHRKNIPRKILEFATWTEIMNNNVPTEEVLERRSHNCVIDWRAESVETADGQEAQRVYQEFKRLVVGEQQAGHIKGMTASTGKVTGRAVVVLHPNQFDQVQEGDILITVMTRPEYLPVMKRAAAFVTDEGGITSHAAIVAREMKKPCVIATKKATKVIQTGQQVEVDAVSGWVTILS